MRLLLLLFIITGVFSSCKSSYFTTINNMRLINGTVITKDGQEIKGQLSANTVNNRTSNFITIETRDTAGVKRIFLTNIQELHVRGTIYEPQLIDAGFGSRDQLLFVKRLTKPGSRLNLYELHEQRTQTNYRRYNSGTYTTDEFTYYLSPRNVPLNEPAWNIEGRRFVPNFEEKMSEIVKDCPSLAEKIRNKEKGYFYAQVSLNQAKRIETVLAIIDEYNSCLN